MLDLYELKQFVCFAENKTLSKVSEIMHISQPTLTRNMKHVEDSFGVSLFIHGKNKLELNETGLKAVEYARALLADEQNAIAMVQAFDRSLRTITVESCAPAPLWILLPDLSSKYPENTISSKLCSIPEIINDVKNEICDIGIIPYAYCGDDLYDSIYATENLSVCIPSNHALASHEHLTFKDINGFNCLLKDEIGFWSELCKQKMPASKFLVQTNDFDMEELIKSSTLLCFTTNFASHPDNTLSNRKIIPITNDEANVTYHLIYKDSTKALISASLAPFNSFSETNLAESSTDTLSLSTVLPNPLPPEVANKAIFFPAKS